MITFFWRALGERSSYLYADARHGMGAPRFSVGGAEAGPERLLK
jgi:hypothetical protein